MPLSDITASIAELATRASISKNRAFSAWYAITFYDIDEDDALEAAASDGGNDQGVDILFYDESRNQMVVLQAYYPDRSTKVTPKEKWDAVVSSVPFLKNSRLFRDQGRNDIADIIDDIQEQHSDCSVVCGLISLGKKSVAIDRSVAAHNATASGTKVSFFSLSQEELLKDYDVLLAAESGIPEDHFDFAGGTFEDVGDYGRAWVGSVSSTELKRLHGAHRDKLFAGNVRLFLGARKGGINEQIVKTAKDKPGAFWALNNGITIVADSVLSGVHPSGGSRFNLKRFSIVNGCQTTSCLVQADGPAEAKVMARVIAAKSGLRNEIVRYNNSQNAVKIWTVRAVDDIQEQLRRDFAKIGVEYAPKQEGARRKKSLQTIDLDKVTQFLASSEIDYLIPAVASKGELFDEPYQSLFPRGIRATDVYLAWLVGKLADEERRKHVEGLGDDPNHGLLGVTSSYWVTFTCFKIIKKISDVKSNSITLERMKKDDFLNALRKYVATAVVMCYDAAVDTYERAEYGSFKSTLRSAKFLSKIDSKINNRLVRLAPKSLPNLAVVGR